MKPVPVQTETITVDSTPEGVANALRQIADAVEEHDLCLIGLWSTGFGEAWEAAIQFIYEPPTDAAGPENVECPRCGGSGDEYPYSPKPCPHCGGTGRENVGCPT